MNNDALFRNILRGLNKNFYNKTVTSKQVEEYISKRAGYNYSKVFDQYLRTTQIPKLEFYFNEDKSKIFYRYTNCVNGFNLPLSLNGNGATSRIIPGNEWKNSSLTSKQAVLFTTDSIAKMYYIKPELVSK